MIGLAATDLTIERNGRAILDGVSVDLAPGAFVALVGANGAGKSTLLSVLAGLLRPDRGEVRLDGTALARIAPRELARRRAYLPQNPRAEWPLPVERLVALGLTPRMPAFGDLPGGLEPALTNALADADLIPQRLQAATTLSGGELGRAMLARALIGDPQVLIADEPMTGLDPRHAMDCVSRLRTLADGGKLVIAAVHDLTLAARYATQLLALRQGRLSAFGPMAATLTPRLLGEVFDVEARISGTGMEATVDLRPAVQ